MIIIDANLLIYAVNSDSPDHTVAREWLERVLSGTQNVGLPWVVLMAFIRLTTRSGILEAPMRTETALSYVDGWLEQPYVQLIQPSPQHWAVFSRLLKRTGSRGNLTTDVHIAALAIENGASVYSADYDFRRFTEIDHVNPLDENVLHDK